jgi:hypothetical protein
MNNLSNTTMKYTTLLLTFLFATLQLSAQQFYWGVPVKLDKEEFSGKATIKRYLLKEDSEGLVRLKVQKNELIDNEDIILEIYDANFELQKTVDILFGKQSNKDLQKVVTYKDKFFLFFAVDNVEMHNTLIVQAYDFEGQPIGDEKALDVITETKALARGEFVIAASENCNHFAVITIPIYGKGENETLKVQLFDAGFNNTFTQQITLDYPSKRFVYNQPFIMNDGTLFMEKYQKIKKVGWVNDLYILDKGNRTFVKKTLQLSNNYGFFTKANTMLENEAGNLIYAGMFMKEGKMQSSDGVFYLEFDKEGNQVREVVEAFNNPPQYGFSGVKLKSIELLPNDELLFVATDFNESAVAQGNDVNNRVYSYTCKTFYFTRLRGDDLVWTKTIERSHMETKSDRGRLLDIVWNYDETTDRVVILYNELQNLYQGTMRNRDYIIPTLATIDAQGEVGFNILLNAGLGNYNDSYTLCPDEFYNRDGFMVLKSSNNIDFKMGRFKF